MGIQLQFNSPIIIQVSLCTYISDMFFFSTLTCLRRCSLIELLRIFSLESCFITIWFDVLELLVRNERVRRLFFFFKEKSKWRVRLLINNELEMICLVVHGPNSDSTCSSLVHLKKLELKLELGIYVWKSSSASKY